MLKLFSAVGAYKQNMYSFVEFLCGIEERHLLTASWLFGNWPSQQYAKKEKAWLPDRKAPMQPNQRSDCMGSHPSSLAGSVRVIEAGWEIVP